MAPRIMGFISSHFESIFFVIVIKSEPKKTDIPQPNEGKKAQPKGKGKIEKGGKKGKVV